MTNEMEKIKIWSEEEGIFVKTKIFPNQKFHIVVGFPKYQPVLMDIFQIEQDKDKIMIWQATRVTENHVSTMRKMSGQERETFEYSLRMMLNDRNNEYKFDRTKGIITQYSIITEIFYDGLTKDRLMKEIREVHKSTIAAGWMMDQLLGEGGIIISR